MISKLHYRPTNQQFVKEKFKEYKNLLLLEEKTGKWQRQVNRWIADFVNSVNVYDVLEATTYLKNLQQKYNAVSYRKMHYQIRKFLQNALDLHYLDKIKLHRINTLEVKTITHDDIKKTIDYFAKDKHALRYKAFILMMSTSGLRPSEAWQLQKEDIDMENKIIHVKVDAAHHTKTGKSRVTFFDNKTKSILSKYLKQNRNRVLFNESASMVAFRNAPLHVKDFRKFFSQEFTRRNGNQLVKEILLGHSLKGNIDAMHYCSLSEEELHEIYRKAMEK